MALIARGMYKLILRTNVRQEINQDGWRFVISNVLPWIRDDERLGCPTFDGEILVIQAMNHMDLSSISEELLDYGFRWTEDLTGADFAWFAFEAPKLKWLEEVSARPLKDDLPDVDLWQLRGSQLGYFVDFDGRVWWRGRDYEW